MSSSPTVSASVARPVRGAGQTGLAYGIVSWLATYHALTAEQFGLAVLVLGAVVTYLHNLLEDRGIIPALLKAEPPPDPVPVVDTTVSDEAAKAVKKAAKRKDRGSVDILTLAIVALIVVIILILLRAV